MQNFLAPNIHPAAFRGYGKFSGQNSHCDIHRDSQKSGQFLFRAFNDVPNGQAQNVVQLQILAFRDQAGLLSHGMSCTLPVAAQSIRRHQSTDAICL